MNIITIDNLTKDYGTTRALDGTSWTLPAGRLLGFLGPNGAGKTTTIRILLGFLKPTAGRATVLGMDAWKNAARIHRRIGYLPGDLHLYHNLTAAQTIRFVARARGLKDLGDAPRLAERLHLDLDISVQTYSKGMRQKLGIIIAMLHRPELLIMDEPTASLDPLMQQVLYDELRNLAAQGHTVLFSSHSLPEVNALCESVVILRHGRVVASKLVSDLRGRKGQTVHVRFTQPVDDHLNCPDGFTVKRRQNRTLEGHWRGEPQQLLNWLATLPLDEVVIQPPDLEDLFLSYYGDSADDQP